jgi:hypothetical protein
VFVAYSVEEWGSYFKDILDGAPGFTFAVRTDGAEWRVRTAPGSFTVRDGADEKAPDVTISGPPTAVLRWVWNRESPAGPSDVTVDGPAEAVQQLKRCIVTATQ